MVAALVLGTSIERCEGSSPSFGTIAEVAKLVVRAELKPQFFMGSTPIFCTNGVA